MTLSPLDDYPVHQAPLPVRQVVTSDRNFYDRYYFNCHAGTDELMLIVGHRPVPQPRRDRCVRAGAARPHAPRGSRVA